MKTFLSILKWTAIVVVLLGLSVFVSVYYLMTDPNDAPLWAGMTMAMLGVIAGVTFKRGK